MKDKHVITLITLAFFAIAITLTMHGSIILELNRGHNKQREVIKLLCSEWDKMQSINNSYNFKEVNAFFDAMENPNSQVELDYDETWEDTYR